MGRIEPDGAQHRQQFAIEVTPHPSRLARVPFAALQEMDVLVGQRRQQQLVQHLVLLGDQGMGAGAYRAQLLLGRHLVGAALAGRKRHLLLQAGDPDLEELVEIAAGDAQELQAFEQRIGDVLGLFEYAPVELQQRQLTVDV